MNFEELDQTIDDWGLFFWSRRFENARFNILHVFDLQLIVLKSRSWVFIELNDDEFESCLVFIHFEQSEFRAFLIMKLYVDCFFIVSYVVFQKLDCLVNSCEIFVHVFFFEQNLRITFFHDSLLKISILIFFKLVSRLGRSSEKNNLLNVSCQKSAILFYEFSENEIFDRIEKISSFSYDWMTRNLVFRAEKNDYIEKKNCIWRQLNAEEKNDVIFENRVWQWGCLEYEIRIRDWWGDLRNENRTCKNEYW